MISKQYQSMLSGKSVIRELSEYATARGQTTAQLALQWTLRDGVVTSALIGASRPEQVIENIACLDFPALTPDELAAIDQALTLAK